MISRERISALAERFQAKADRAYRNYQETGAQRYDRERINNEELAEVLTAAANTAEEHMAFVNLKSEMMWYAAVFDRALLNDVERKDLAGIIEGFIKTASTLCAYRRIRDGE